MSRVHLCLGRYAKIPYEFEAARTRVFCVEELSYFLKENAWHLDDSIFTMKLADWVEEQCNLPELAQKLRFLVRCKSKPENFVRQIFEYTGYYDPQELKETLKQVAAGADIAVAEKRKARGDYYLESRKYVLALQEYRNLLNSGELLAPSVEAKIYHNMGIAQVRLFLFEKAAVYFEKAWLLGKEEKSLIAWLSSLRMYMKEPEYLNFLTEHPDYYETSLRVERQMSKRKESWVNARNESVIASMKGAFFSGEEAECSRLMENELDSMKEKYRGYVTV